MVIGCEDHSAPPSELQHPFCARDGGTGFIADSDFFCQSGSASRQSDPAWRMLGSGALYVFPEGMMHGGTDSVQLFRQMFAGALPQRALAESCPRTLPHVG